MAGRGGGPSRRSHTKSRKGCKTCKRRHIRCDETFPQCRNCTKHQVRCDYMDMPAIEEPLRVTTAMGLSWTPDIERIVEHWQRTGQFPFSDLEIYPQPQVRHMSRNEMRLLYHVCDALTKLRQSRTSKLAMWTELMPKCLMAAVRFPFVMDAIYAFGACHLYWEAKSNEARALAIDYINSATRGLQDSLRAFSQTNADGVLAASLILSWLQNDWRGWAFSMSSLKTIIHVMQRFRSESMFQEYLASQPIDPLQQFANDSSFTITNDSSLESQKQLQNIQAALNRLAGHLPMEEPHLIAQVSSLIESMRHSAPPASPREQFELLYPLREMLFWLPVNLLSHRRGDLPTLLILSHLYATALLLESSFPDVGAPFVASLAATPLMEIITIIQTVSQQSASYDPLAQSASMMMDFPQDALASFRARREWAAQQVPISSQQTFAPENLSFELLTHLADPQNHTPNLSPAFASPALHATPPPLASQLPRSPYMDMPGSAVDMYGYKPFTPSSSYHTTPTSAFAGSPMDSPGIRHEGESSSGHQLPMPNFPGSRTSMGGYGGLNMSPMSPYAMNSSGGGHPGSTNIVSGTGHRLRQQQQLEQRQRAAPRSDPDDQFESEG